MNSVEKTASILKKIGEEPYEFSLAELATAAQCGKSCAYKILSVLVRMGLVDQKENKKYCTGYEAYKLKISYENRAMQLERCLPIMEELRDVTGETVTLAIWNGEGAVILYRVQSTENLRVEGNLGKRLPINASAHGKLLAAYQDNADMRVKDHPLIRYQECTITDKDRLLEEYRLIREAGYSISDEEMTKGVLGVAAPVLDTDGRVSVSLCCGIPKIRLNKEKLNAVIEAVKMYAKKLSLER